MNTTDENYFKATCVHCGVNVETPNELYDQSVDCPGCGKNFLARPNEKIEQPKKPQSFFTALCFKCGENVKIPVERYNQIAECPLCDKEFIALPVKASAKSPSGLTCPFCKSGNIGEGTMRLTTGGVILVVVGIFLIFALIGVFFLLAANRMREMKYTCGNCRKSF